jgi:hypothetical protein
MIVIKVAAHRPERKSASRKEMLFEWALGRASED